MVEFTDNDYVISCMSSELSSDDLYALENLTTCYTTDDYRTHFICVIIMEDFVFVAQTFAEDFKAKRKLIRLMKQLYIGFGKRVLVGKDSEMFNRSKVSLNDDIDEIIIRSSRWAEAEQQ